MTSLEWFVAIFWGLFLADILVLIAIVSTVYKKFGEIADRLKKLEDTNEAR